MLCPSGPPRKPLTTSTAAAGWCSSVSRDASNILVAQWSGIPSGISTPAGMPLPAASAACGGAGSPGRGLQRGWRARQEGWRHGYHLTLAAAGRHEGRGAVEVG